jgi:S1-C subfamily serine protease
VKEYLSQRSIPFRDVDVSRDRAAAEEMVRITGQQGVPVTVIDGQPVVGFDRARIDAMLREAQRPRLGAAVADAASMARRGRSSESHGAYVGRVSPGGVAERAGLQAGDVIVALAGRDVHSALHLEQLVAAVRPGQRLPLSFVRAGQRHDAVLSF